MTEKPYYYLDLTAEFCTANALLNGFPILTIKADLSPTNVAVPLNRALVRKNNQLIVQPLPPLNSAYDQEAIEKIKLNAVIKLYGEDDISAPENGEILESENASGLNPVSIEFDNQVLDFSQTILNNPRIEDKEQIKKYALRLQALLKSEDVSAIAAEFKPKIMEMAEAYYEDPSGYFVGFQSYLENEILPNHPILDWSEKELVIVPYCDKRLWELRIVNSEFIVTLPDEDGYENIVRVFVAEINGELKIIR